MVHSRLCQFAYGQRYSSRRCRVIADCRFYTLYVAVCTDIVIFIDYIYNLIKTAEYGMCIHQIFHGSGRSAARHYPECMAQPIAKFCLGKRIIIFVIGRSYIVQKLVYIRFMNELTFIIRLEKLSKIERAIIIS